MMMVVVRLTQHLFYTRCLSKHLICSNSLNCHLMRQVLLVSLLTEKETGTETLSSCSRLCNWSVVTLGLNSKQSGSRVLF